MQSPSAPFISENSEDDYRGFNASTITVSSSNGRTMACVTPTKRPESAFPRINTSISSFTCSLPGPDEQRRPETHLGTSTSNQDTDRRRIKVEIKGYKILEPRDRFTLKARNGIHFNLPPKRAFKNNFDQAFLDEREKGLGRFIRDVIRHADKSKSVRDFFRLDNHPGPDEDFETCQFYRHKAEQDLEKNRERFVEQDQEMDLVRKLLQTYSSEKLDQNISLLEVVQDVMQKETEKINDLKREVNASHQREQEMKANFDEYKKSREKIEKDFTEARDEETRLCEERLQGVMNEYHMTKDGIRQNINGLMSECEKTNNTDIQRNLRHIRLHLDTCDAITERYIEESITSMQSKMKEAREKCAKADSKIDIRDSELRAIRAKLRTTESRIQQQERRIESLGDEILDLKQYKKFIDKRYFFTLALATKLEMYCGVGEEIKRLQPRNYYKNDIKGTDPRQWPKRVYEYYHGKPEPRK